MAEAKPAKETKKKQPLPKVAPKAKKTVTKKKEGVKDGTTQKVNKATAEASREKTVAKAVRTEPQTESIEEKTAKSTAKAGKRSTKALKELEEKQAKEERKAQAVTEETSEKSKITPRTAQRTAEDRLKSRGKKYQKVYELIDKNKVYGLAEALEVATKTSPVAFDASVELHIRLNVDPKQADQNIRDMVVLPAGSGKNIRVAVFADAEGVAAAKKAGADSAASDEFLQQLDKGTINFDILIATPAMMPKLGKYARLLGPKGLMPNPKSGTVASDVTRAVNDAKGGRVEYRVDSTGIVHLAIGKVSFGGQKLTANAAAVLGSIKANKPGSIKGVYIKTVYVTTSMGPSLQVSPTDS